MERIKGVLRVKDLVAVVPDRRKVEACSVVKVVA